MTLRPVIFSMVTAIFVLKLIPYMYQHLTPMNGSRGLGLPRGHHDWSWDPDSSWYRTQGGNSPRAFSTPQKDRRHITTLAWKHPVPLSNRRELLVSLIKELYQGSVPVIFIHNWTPQLIQAVFYLLCKMQPDFPARQFFDDYNNFDLDQAVRFLLECFYANFPTQHSIEVSFV